VVEDESGDSKKLKRYFIAKYTRYAILSHCMPRTLDNLDC